MSSSGGSGNSGSGNSKSFWDTSKYDRPIPKFKSKPRIQIQSHVLAFSILMSPALYYAYYYYNNKPTDEQLLEELNNSGYSKNIEETKQQKQALVDFVQKIKQGSTDKKQEENLMNVLHGGKGEMKRNYAVKDDLYGTEKGVQTKQNTIYEQQKEEGDKQKAHNKSIIVVQSDDDDDDDDTTTTTTTTTTKSSKRIKKTENENTIKRGKKKEKQQQESSSSLVTRSGDVSSSSSSLSDTTTTIVSVAAIGTIAAIGGFLLGSNSRQR